MIRKEIRKGSSKAGNKKGATHDWNAGSRPAWVYLLESEVDYYFGICGTTMNLRINNHRHHGFIKASKGETINLKRLTLLPREEALKLEARLINASTNDPKNKNKGGTQSTETIEEIYEEIKNINKIQEQDQIW